MTPSAQPPERRPSGRWLFLAKFFRHGTVIGAVAPSSRWLARAMLDGIDWQAARCVVELGAGTGAVTAELLRRAGGRCRAVVIERDADFCDHLRSRFPGAEVAQADARNLGRLLAERGVAAVDHVLCGLALPWFTPADRHTILDGSRRLLTPEGSFRQLTYMPWIHTKVYRRYFEQVGFRFVWRNFPPGGCYVCRVPRPEGPRPRFE
jgi:phospholipid N-methyltransferase